MGKQRQMTKRTKNGDSNSTEIIPSYTYSLHTTTTNENKVELDGAKNSNNYDDDLSKPDDEEDAIEVLARNIQLLCDTRSQGLLELKPSPETVTVWRNVISTSYYYPCILRHSDLVSIYQLFLLLGVKLQCDSTDIYIPLDSQPVEETSKVSTQDGLTNHNDNTGVTLSKPTEPNIQDFCPKPPCKHYVIRPTISSKNGHVLVPVQLIFGHIENCEYDLTSRVVIIRKYRMLPNIRSNIEEMVIFLLTQPRQLYSDTYGFIYDFLIRFGIKPRKIDTFVNILLDEGNAEEVNKLARKRKFNEITSEDQENLDTDEDEDCSEDVTREKAKKHKMKELRVNVGLKAGVGIMTELNNNQSQNDRSRRKLNSESEDDDSSQQSSSDSESSSSSPTSSDSDESESDNSVGYKFRRRFSRNNRNRNSALGPPAQVPVKECASFHTLFHKQPDVAETEKICPHNGLRNGIGRSSLDSNVNGVSDYGFEKSESTLRGPMKRSRNSYPTTKIHGKIRQNNTLPNDDKPISCPSETGCSVKFQTRNAMLHHFRTQHATEPQPLRLTNKDGLIKKRNIVPEKDKPFGCPSMSGCGVRFLWRATMLTHFKVKHPNETLPAELESRSFNRSVALVGYH